MIPRTANSSQGVTSRTAPVRKFSRALTRALTISETEGIAMKRIAKLIDRLLEGGTLVSFIALIAVVFLQVFARFALPKVPHWTEEASRIFFIYTVCFAGGLAVRDKAYVNVDLIINRFPTRFRAFMQLLLDGLIAGFMAVVLYYSFPFIEIGTIQKSPALRITMSYLFASMTLLSGTVILYTLYDMARDVRILAGRSE